MRTSRRAVLQHSAALAALLAASGLLGRGAQAQPAGAWNKAAFEARSFDEALRVLGAAKPQESRDVVLEAPEIAEDGASVRLAVGTALPGVQRLALLVEKNPSALAAVFDLGSGLDPRLATRVRLTQTSLVYAVALMTDGRVLYARREVKLALGPCA